MTQFDAICAIAAIFAMSAIASYYYFMNRNNVK